MSFNMRFRDIRPKKLTRDAFAQYGAVIETPTDYFIYPCDRSNYWPTLGEMPCGNGILQVGIEKLLSAPLRFERMRRHMKSHRIMVPIDGPMLVAVSRNTGGNENAFPEFEDTEAFFIDTDHGVKIDAGVWFYTLPYKDETAMMVVTDKDAQQCDLIESDFKEDSCVEIQIKDEDDRK